MPAARSKPTSQPKPVSLAARYAQQEQRQALLRLGAALAPILFVVVPKLPSPIAGYDWKAWVWQGLAPTLMQSFPPAGTAPIPPQPLLTWISVAWAVAGIWLIGSQIQHLMSLYAQRTRPLTLERTYLRLRTPFSVTLKPEDGVTLLRTLHGILPRSNLLRGDGTPVVLRWTGRPELAVVQGLSVQGPPTLITSLQKVFQGVSRGTKVDIQSDPLLAELKPGRVICWTDIRLQGPDALAIAIPARESPLLSGLLQTLSPLRDCFVSDFQILLRPVADRVWRTKVLAMLERLKLDAASTEKRVMEQKVAGPAFDLHVRAIVVAASPEAGQTMVTTICAALAASAQAIANAEQRLVAGPIQVLPAVIPAPPPFPVTRARLAWLTGLILAMTALGAVWYVSSTPRSAWLGPAIWVLPVPLLALPRTVLGTLWYRGTRAGLPVRLNTILKSVMPARNPRVVPIWSDWLGHLS
ncbi:MAG TPA: hypothetical protein VFZ66_03640 [Herpetosiphonaceae bacterium]